MPDHYSPYEVRPRASEEIKIETLDSGFQVIVTSYPEAAEEPEEDCPEDLHPYARRRIRGPRVRRCRHAFETYAHVMAFLATQLSTRRKRPDASEKN